MEGYVLSDYALYKCILLKKGKVNYKVQYKNTGCITYVKPEKFAFPNENICVVYMPYRGIIGSYRIERSLYSEIHKPAKEWPYQWTAYEDSYGVINKDDKYKSLKKNKKAFEHPLRQQLKAKLEQALGLNIDVSEETEQYYNKQ